MSLTVIHLAALILAQPPADSTKPRPISQMVHTTWTAKDGAPSEVYAFAQTRDGYLWIGTRSGLVRFDGVRFVPFSAPTGDTLPTGGVRSMRATRDGSLWVVSTSGWVSRVRDGRVTSFGEKDGVPSTHQLAESRGGTLLAATTKGIRRFAGGNWNDVNPEWQYNGGDTKAIWFDREDALWVEAHDRFLYLPAGANRFVDPGMKLLDGSARGEFAETKDGTIWFSEISRSAHTVPRLGDSRPVTEVLGGTLHLLVDRKGSLWIGSVGGGLRRVLDPTKLHGGKIGPSDPIGEIYGQKEGLLTGIVNGIFEDRESNVWVATDRGIERFRESAFTPFPASGPARPRFVFASRDTSIWSAAFGDFGIVRIGPRSRDSISTLTMLTNVVEDRSGALRFATHDRVGWIKDLRMPNAWVGTPGAVYDGITADSAGNVWVREAAYGLARVTPTGVVRADSLPAPARSLAVRRMFADRLGRIWIGHAGHISMDDDGHFRLFGPEHGVMPGSINGFLEDHAGNLWVVGDAGISKFDGDHFRSLTRRQSLPGRSVYGVAEDALGAWWVVTPGGVLRLPPGETDRALADSNYSIRYRSFGAADGIPGMLSGTAWGAQVTRAADGRIWIAADSGIASIDPRNLPKDAAPEVLIEAARVGGRELTWPASALGPGVSDLEIDYTATALANPERIQFRYRMEGADSAWHDAAARRRAYFTRLAPGSYVFRVSARNGEGPWSEAGAVWSFRVLPAWYQTLWFRAAVLLMFGGLIAAGSAMLQRRRDLQAREKLKNEYNATLAERARIAQDLHDTLLQGFIGVTVQIQAAESALSNQPYAAAQAVLAERLAQASLLARASLQEARECVWDMREELGTDDLPAVLESCAREWTAGSEVQISVHTTGKRRRLSGRLEDAAFRIGREAIINAVQHAESRCIEICVEFGPRMVRLDVSDDGRGFSAEEAEEARRKGHFGLSGARERAGFIGGRFDVRPRPGGGTIVSLELPLQNAPKDESSLSASTA